MKMKRIGLILFFGGLILAFQNCAKNANVSIASLNLTAQGSSPTPVPIQIDPIVIVEGGGGDDDTPPPPPPRDVCGYDQTRTNDHVTEVDNDTTLDLSSLDLTNKDMLVLLGKDLDGNTYPEVRLTNGIVTIPIFACKVVLKEISIQSCSASTSIFGKDKENLIDSFIELIVVQNYSGCNNKANVFQGTDYQWNNEKLAVSPDGGLDLPDEETSVDSNQPNETTVDPTTSKSVRGPLPPEEDTIKEASPEGPMAAPEVYIPVSAIPETDVPTAPSAPEATEQQATEQSPAAPRSSLEQLQDELSDASSLRDIGRAFLNFLF